MIIVDLSSSITLQHRCYQQLTFIIVITIIKQVIINIIHIKPFIFQFLII